MKRFVFAAFQLPSTDDRDLDDEIFDELMEDDDVFEAIRDKFNRWFTRNVSKNYDGGNVWIEYATEDNPPRNYDCLFRLITQFEDHGDYYQVVGTIAYNRETHAWKLLDKLSLME